MNTILRIFIASFHVCAFLIAGAWAADAELSEYIAFDQETIALTHVQLIDGNGTAPKPNMTVIIKDGKIHKIGDSEKTVIPPQYKVVDMTGRSALPGLVMMHEHLYYDTYSGFPNTRYQPYTYPRLYLACGVTTARATGAMNGYLELNLKKNIDTGIVPGPDFDITTPMFTRNGPLLQMKHLRGPDDARKMLEYWAYEGCTSVKVHEGITTAELAVVIEESHARGLKVTGHLGAVTFRKGAEMGIDNIEHGLAICPDFVEGKTPDVAPHPDEIRTSIVNLDMDGSEVSDLIQHLIEHEVALTSTLPVLEYRTSTHEFSTDRIFELLHPHAHDALNKRVEEIRSPNDEIRKKTEIRDILYSKSVEFERRFFEAGGLLLSGTDPLRGDLIAGFSNHLQVELLVQAGFSPLDAIKVSSLNGAIFLDREDEIGSIEEGKKSDLFIVTGDPSTNISDIRNVEFVFKSGVGYDSEKLIKSCEGLVGIR